MKFLRIPKKNWNMTSYIMNSVLLNSFLRSLPQSLRIKLFQGIIVAIGSSEGLNSVLTPPLHSLRIIKLFQGLNSTQVIQVAHHGPTSRYLEVALLLYVILFPTKNDNNHGEEDIQGLLIERHTQRKIKTFQVIRHSLIKETRSIERVVVQN